LQIQLRLSLAHNLGDFRNANDDRTAASEAKDAVFPLVTRLRSFALLVIRAKKKAPGWVEPGACFCHTPWGKAVSVRESGDMAATSGLGGDHLHGGEEFGSCNLI
jgi:hypothetical protein